MINVNGFFIIDESAILAVYDSFDSREINRLKATAHTFAALVGGAPSDYVDAIVSTVRLASARQYDTAS